MIRSPAQLTEAEKRECVALIVEGGAVDRGIMTPKSLDGLLDALNREWALGVARLTEFERLFGKAERVALLNRLGGELFADV